MAAEHRPNSLAPGDVVRRWPLWLQWLTVVGIVSSPTGILTVQRSGESAELTQLRADVTRLREAVAADHDQTVAGRERLARIERDLAQIAESLAHK